MYLVMFNTDKLLLWEVVRVDWKLDGERLCTPELDSNANAYRAGTGNLVVMDISYRTSLSFLEAICILNDYDDVYLVRSGLSWFVYHGNDHLSVAGIG